VQRAVVWRGAAPATTAVVADVPLGADVLVRSGLRPVLVMQRLAIVVQLIADNGTIVAAPPGSLTAQALRRDQLGAPAAPVPIGLLNELWSPPGFAFNVSLFPVGWGALNSVVQPCVRYVAAGSTAVGRHGTALVYWYALRVNVTLGGQPAPNYGVLVNGALTATNEHGSVLLGGCTTGFRWVARCDGGGPVTQIAVHAFSARRQTYVLAC